MLLSLNIFRLEDIFFAKLKASQWLGCSACPFQKPCNPAFKCSVFCETLQDIFFFFFALNAVIEISRIDLSSPLALSFPWFLSWVCQPIRGCIPSMLANQGPWLSKNTYVLTEANCTGDKLVFILCSKIFLGYHCFTEPFLHCGMDTVHNWILPTQCIFGPETVSWHWSIKRSIYMNNFKCTWAFSCLNMKVALMRESKRSLLWLGECYLIFNKQEILDVMYTDGGLANSDKA